MKLNLNNYLKEHSPGYVIEIDNNGTKEELVIGNKQILPKVEKTTKDTYYDLASLTKTYTAVLVYMAYEEKKLDIYDTITKLDSNFKSLQEVTVLDLLGHRQDIWTDGYLGNAKTKEEFYQIIYTAYVKEKGITYVDAHYMILSTILEKLYQKPYDEILKEKILIPLNLTHTTFHPDPNNTASNNYEHTKNGVVEDILPGFIHDTKGRVAASLGIKTGHASLFATGSDLLKFLRSFLDNSLLTKETIKIMLSHLDINSYNKEFLKQYSKSDDLNIMYADYLKTNPTKIFPRTFNNMSARYKNKIKVLNDVPDICSDNTISFSGYTGPMYTIDFDNKIIVVIMCNVMHNTNLNREQRKTKTIEIMNIIFKNLLN